MNRLGGRDVATIPQSPADAMDSLDATGGVMTVATRAPSVARFLANVTKTAGCWEWALARDPKGYGKAHVKRRSVLAHRLSYELFVGPIPDGLQVDHLCRNTSCVRPDHLEAVTPAENNRRSNSLSAVRARTTRCPAGHPYDAANTYVAPKTGGRDCKACRLQRNREWYARKRATA